MRPLLPRSTVTTTSCPRFTCSPSDRPTVTARTPAARSWEPRHPHVDAVAAERYALGLEQRALAGALRERAVGAHDPVPRQRRVVAAGEDASPRSAARPARRRRRRARTPPACRGCGRARGRRARTRRISSRAMRHGTYSIVALDPETGELGAAVQSHWFSRRLALHLGAPGRRRGRHAVRRRAGPRAERARPARRPATARRARRSRSCWRPTRCAPCARSASSTRAAASPCPPARTASPYAGDAGGAHWSCQANMMERDTVPGRDVGGVRGRRRATCASRLLAALQARRGRGRRRPRPPVGRAAGRARRRASRGGRASTCASRTTTTRSPSSTGCSRCSAPTSWPARPTS